MALGVNQDVIDRAQGCFLGQIAGDLLGSLVEFKSQEEIERLLPRGLDDAIDSGQVNAFALQPTDDSEMALALARALVKKGRYDKNYVRDSYIRWLNSDPPSYGATVEAGLRGRPNVKSQANGALMRISPLGIFGANRDLEFVASWAREDAEITHPNPVCVQANELFAMAVAFAIRNGPDVKALYEQIARWADEKNVEPTVRSAVIAAEKTPPQDYLTHQGWVLIAFQNALWQLLHAPNFKRAIVGTIMRGGDADTNAAICGALVGAVYGKRAVPEKWIDIILKCRAENGGSTAIMARPREYWPVDVMDLAQRLLISGSSCYI